MKSITVQELKSLLDANTPIQIIDVRSRAEWHDGHIQSDMVKNIDVNALMGCISEIKKDIPTYVICASGGRSSIAQVLLKNLGIEVVNVQGGMNAWTSKGYSIIS